MQVSHLTESLLSGLWRTLGGSETKIGDPRDVFGGFRGESDVTETAFAGETAIQQPAGTGATGAADSDASNPKREIILFVYKYLKDV